MQRRKAVSLGKTLRLGEKALQISGNVYNRTIA